VTVGEIIEQARGMHPAFDRWETPDRPLLKAIHRASKKLHAEITQVNPDAIDPERCVLELPLFDFEDGEELEGLDYVVDSWAVRKDGALENFSLLDSAHRVSPEKWPSGFLRGQRIFLIHNLKQWETRFTGVVVEYVKLPAEPVNLASEVGLPDLAEGALVADIAFYMAQRARDSSTGPGVNVSEFRRERDRERSDFRTAVGNQRTATVGHVREVW